MRVLLRPEVFTSRCHVELMVLLWLGGHGRHRIFPHPIEQKEYTDWVAALDPDTRSAWQEMVEASFERERLREAQWEIAVTVNQSAIWSHATPLLPVSEALDLLLQPYRIVLENNVNDRAFFLAMCRNHEAHHFREFERRGWLHFEMGGGTTIGQRVEQIRRSEALRRMASVLVDSDAMRPPDKSRNETIAHVEGTVASMVRKSAGDSVVGVHWKVLKRRAIENYLPLKALRRWQRGNDERHQIVECFETLTRDQQNHYNMKKGFAGDLANQIRAGDLYNHPPISDRTSATLDSGFGSNVAELFHDYVRVEDLDHEAQAELREFVHEVLARIG